MIEKKKKMDLLDPKKVLPYLKNFKPGYFAAIALALAMALTESWWSVIVAIVGFFVGYWLGVDTDEDIVEVSYE